MFQFLCSKETSAIFQTDMNSTFNKTKHKQYQLKPLIIQGVQLSREILSTLK